MSRIPLLLWIVALCWLLSGPARAFDIQQVVSPGGIEAWLIEDHSNPIIALKIGFRGGAGLDPVGKEGLAIFAAATIDEGAGDLDSEAFQRTLADQSISLSFDAGRDSVSGSLATLTENRDQAFDLLRRALTAPRFDDEAVERIREQLLVNARREETNPSAVAGKRLMAHLFPDHPYGRTTDGSPASLVTITHDDLRTFVAARFGRDNLVIGVVGDITAADLAPILDTTFGGLPEKAAPWELPDAEPAADGSVEIIDMDVAQSAITFAHGGIRRDNPDFYAATVMNYLLGGGSFKSRLYTEVREKRGLAYSVYSYLYPLDHAALLAGGAGTANARAGETVQVLRDVWRGMARDGISQSELEDAKTYLTGSFPLRFTSSGKIAGILMAVQMENLGIDYLDRRNDLIEAVTLEDVNRVISRLLQPDKMTFVIVGRPEGVN
ncbi:MAG: M16 family metallopeptidase [Magnetospiraceae bacterium]